MVLAAKRIQPQRELCCICLAETVDDDDLYYTSLIVDISEPEVGYYTTDRECEGCAFGIE